MHRNIVVERIHKEAGVLQLCDECRLRRAECVTGLCGGVVLCVCAQRLLEHREHQVEGVRALLSARESSQQQEEPVRLARGGEEDL